MPSKSPKNPTHDLWSVSFKRTWPLSVEKCPGGFKNFLLKTILSGYTMRWKYVQPISSWISQCTKKSSQQYCITKKMSEYLIVVNISKNLKIWVLESILGHPNNCKVFWYILITFFMQVNVCLPKFWSLLKSRIFKYVFLRFT